jgi:hypothetical protein
MPLCIVEGFVSESETAIPQDSPAFVGLASFVFVFGAVVVFGRPPRSKRLFPGLNLPERRFERFRGSVIEALDVPPDGMA